VFVREIRAGDVVLLREGVRVTARGVQFGELGEERKPIAYLFDTAGRQWLLHPGDVVELVRRSYAAGATVCDMLDAVDAAITRYRLGLVPVEQGRMAILQALREYVLGKPEEPRQGGGDAA
jgi:hypothetical protein